MAPASDAPAFDPLSGRSLPRDDPWRQVLHQRQALKNHNHPSTPQVSPERSVPPAASRAPPVPRLPATDYKIIIRPRSGLRVGAWTTNQITNSLQVASNIPAAQFYSQVTVQPQAQNNLIAVSTPNEAIVDALRFLTAIQLGSTAYEVTAYMKPPPGTSRGVIQGITPGTTPHELRMAIHTTGPPILDIRMLGKSHAALITFDGPHVPFFVRAYSALTRCRPYRNTYQCCAQCGELGHRQDICPDPHRNICAQCHTPNPTPTHDCVPCCKLCGLTHTTASKECKRKLKPSPPPAFRNVISQALPMPPSLTQANYPRLAPADSTKVSWSAIVSPPPTAAPPQNTAPTTLHTTNTTSPEPETVTLLREENARLKNQLSQQTHQINALQAQITELKQLITANNTSKAMQNSQPSSPAPSHGDVIQNDPMPTPIAPTLPQVQELINFATDSIKAFLSDAVKTINSRIDRMEHRFQNCEERLEQLEHPQGKKHKKSKQHPLPPDPEQMELPDCDDEDSL